MIEVAAERPDRIGFEVAYARRRNRVTVCFRAILAIPQVIVVYILGIAAAVVAVIGWFGALFMGRLPRWAAEFLGGYACWVTRVYAYLGLLVDAYPPFDFDAPASYPVQVRVPLPGRLNRAAVLFRVILAIPAYIVGGLANTGLGIASVVVWLILLVGGRMPRSLFLAIASVLRYYLRVYGYFLMLTPAYPSGLFAEPVAVGESGGPGAASGADPRAWAVAPTPLSSGAKVIVSAFLVLGLAGQVAYWSLGGSTFGFANLAANAELSVAHQQFVSADHQALRRLDACQAHNPTLNCVELAYSSEGAAYSGFASQLDAISFRVAAAADAALLTRDVKAAGREFQYVAGAPSQAAFDAEVGQDHLKALARAVRQDYAALRADLSGTRYR
ncbi:MAG: DUF4389 domain-containing protein [Acidimicrobiales bacterium]